MSDPVIRIKFEDADGKALIAPVELRIPGALSLKVASMCVFDLVGKALKAGVPDALKKQNFK